MRARIVTSCSFCLLSLNLIYSQSRRRISFKMAREIVVRDEKIGVLSGQKFVSFTNFCVEVVSAVGTSELGLTVCGYLFQVKIHGEKKHRHVYVSCENMRSLNAFTKALANTHHHATSRALVKNNEWLQYISSITQEFMRIHSNRKKLLLATYVGRQPQFSVWVFGPDCQIDGSGNLIPIQETSYFWHPGNQCVRPSNIHLPLGGIQVLEDVVAAQKECLHNNFLSFFLALAGGIMLFHSQALHDIWEDEYPVVLCYSQGHETGKTLSLKTILQIFDANGKMFGTSSTITQLIRQAAFSTTPIGVDGFEDSEKLQKLVFYFLNACKKAPQKKRWPPKTGMLITANGSFAKLRKIAIKSGWRIVHIPFWEASQINDCAAQMESEQKLIAACKIASSVVGEIVCLEGAINSPLTRTYVAKHLLPFLDDHLHQVHHRVKECYAWVLVVARLICQMMPRVVTYSEVITYFVDKVCPVITPGGPHRHRSRCAVPAVSQALLTAAIGESGGRVSETRVSKPDKLRAYGPGLEKATALETAEFFMDVTEAGDGDIGIAIYGPAECKVNVEDKGDGTYHCTYVAPRPGVYHIDVKFADEDIPDSPFEAICTRPPPDASKCVISGLENPGGFKVDCVDAGGTGVPEVNVSGKYVPCECVSVKHNGDYTFDVSYDIREPGETTISVSWHGQHLKGSPFTVSRKV